MIEYGFVRKLNTDFEQSIEAVTKALEKTGFGVLTTIDVKEKFKQKLGIDFDNYTILGACKPPKAHQAIQAEQNIGLMLPCNVIVYEKGGTVTVAAIRPTVAMQMINNPRLSSIAAEVEAQLKQVIESLS